MEWGALPIPLFIVVSIVLNCIIAIFGVIPSAFLTAINVRILGFEAGVTLSIFGEALGAIISFILYRKALRKYTSPKDKRFQRLREARGMEAWFLVLGMRLLPFVPSGLVTLSAAFSRMKLSSFAIASTIGKVPALILEALAAVYLLKNATLWQLGAILGLGILYAVWRFYQSKGDKR